MCFNDQMRSPASIKAHIMIIVDLSNITTAPYRYLRSNWLYWGIWVVLPRCVPPITSIRQDAVDFSEKLWPLRKVKNTLMVVNDVRCFLQVIKLDTCLSPNSITTQVVNVAADLI